MAEVIAFAGAMHGQGISSAVAGFASHLTRKSTVCAIDLDEGGTNALTEYLLAADEGTSLPDGRSLAQLVQEKGVRVFYRGAYVTHEQVQGQAVASPSNRNLAVVPGFVRECGGGLSEVLTRLGPALKELPYAYVLLDLGAPFMHPRMTISERDAIAEDVRAYADRVYWITRDDMVSMAKAMDTLSLISEKLQPQVVVWEALSGRHWKEVEEDFAQSVPGVPIVRRIRWVPKAYEETLRNGRFSMNVGSDVAALVTS